MMMMSVNEEQDGFMVLLNDEGQYSIWPDQREIPTGWNKAGYSGSKEACISYVDEIWTDMRPKSLVEFLSY
jgi:MbtH protein